MEGIFTGYRAGGRGDGGHIDHTSLLLGKKFWTKIFAQKWNKLFLKKGKALKSFDFKASVVVDEGFEPSTSGL